MRKQSFTLLEVLVSIGIIAILAAITFGGLNYASSRAQEAKTIANMETFISALEAFRQDYGHYPIVNNGNPTQIVLPSSGNSNDWDLFMNENNHVNKRNKAYIEGEPGEYVDGYGMAFWYQYPGGRNSTKFDLWSMGADKEHGNKRGKNAADATHAGENGSDDICSWKQR